jgi:MFS transporter, DHA2 family, multidrug resistance protein
MSIVRDRVQGGQLAAWVGFLAMCLGMFMAILDIQIVASSLPEIQAALDIPLDRLSWVQTAYLIAEVVAIPLTGRLTRLLSLRGLFVLAIAGFCFASIGCALSQGFGTLILFRTIQGFCGGTVIPAVFTAGFELFPEGRRILPTTVAGVFAMMAPTLGPVVGGYITDTYSWHWLFLINLGPGLLVLPIVGWFIRVDRPDWSLLPRLDYAGVALMAISLGSLEVLLKEGPKRHWAGLFVFLCAMAVFIAGFVIVRRCLYRADPIVELRLLADRSFAVSCIHSFVLGMGLYGSVYVLPLFLGLVREHSPLEIGEIMTVCGGAQLAIAPFAAAAEKRFDPRWIAALGYALFAAGLISNGFTGYDTDFPGLFWPQVLRGAGVMLCLLPAATIALGHRSGDMLANASALFNLMRNLGGAIGISLIDTILERRPAVHVAELVKRLQAGDPGAALIVGLPVDKFHNVPVGPVDEATKEAVATLVERAALVLSFNEAWLLFGALFVLAMLAIPLMRRTENGHTR